LLREYDQAVVFQESVARLDPNDSQTRVELGLNYLARQHEPARAVPVLREAALLDPSPRNRSLLAQALAASGRTEEARSELEDLLKDSPDYKFGRNLLASLGSA